MQKLNSQRINYVLSHIRQLAEWGNDLDNDFVFDQRKDLKNKVIFSLSESELNIENVLYINKIPILFPLSKSDKPYTIDSKNNLIFNHDFLSSAFYLLSGMQEYKSDEKDKYNRFPFDASIQHKLDFIGIPVVNYYFEWIIKGLEEFASIHSLEFFPKQQAYRFILTHDIDFVDKYTLFNLANGVKTLLGLTKDKTSVKQVLSEIVANVWNTLKFSRKDNPYWNFEFLVHSKPSSTFRHIFFFLEKDQLHHDSYYTFQEKRIKKLFKYLINQNCEIGIHGTVASSESKSKMEETLNNLKSNAEAPINCNRQHRLHYKLPDTAIIHEDCGIKEDFSLGFAAHEGFRNSYCHPFKLYDFESERMINVWQYPLNVMDTTLMYYHDWNKQNAIKKISSIMNEVKRFNGVFTLLWHNNNFDENSFKQIKATFKKAVEISSSS